MTQNDTLYPVIYDTNRYLASIIHVYKLTDTLHHSHVGHEMIHCITEMYDTN